MDPRGAQSPHRVEDKCEGLNGGQEPPTISVVARDELDSWLADDPSLDEYLQRDPNTSLERMARVYNQERAALLAGMSDVATRVRDLGSVIDTAHNHSRHTNSSRSPRESIIDTAVRGISK